MPTQRRARPGLLSRISTKDSCTRSSVSVLAHARELLRIVFAKSGGSAADPAVSFISTTASSTDDTSDVTRKASLTFAMRYRALRTAAVLCPQVALDKVVAEEGYLNGSLGEVKCSLSKCTYGAFVAKEIEEMGLPLPHSDLLALSTMHFPSYARALWRHHRDVDIRGKKGRLLLLLLEMSLRDNTESELTATLLNEMSKLQLPRTLLLGCECVAKCKLNDKASQPTSLRSESEAVSNAVLTAANLVVSEIHFSLSSIHPKIQDLDKCLPTIRRTGHLVEIFSEGETGQRQLFQFVKVLADLVALGDNSFSTHLAEIALSAAHSLRHVQSRKQMLRLLSQHPRGQQVIHRRWRASATRDRIRSNGGNLSTMTSLVFEAEESYNPSVLLTKD